MGNLMCCVQNNNDQSESAGQIYFMKNGKKTVRRNLLKQLAIILRFIYCIRVKIRLRKYVIEEVKLMTVSNAKNDKIAKSKENEVVELSKTLKKYRDKGVPFKDKAKLIFKGMTQLPNGDKYQGNWVEGKEGVDVIQGKGVYVYANGSEFFGYFYNQKIVGDGRIIYHNGDIYEGDFVDDEYHGQGKYIFGDTHKVSGYFVAKFEHNKAVSDILMNVNSKKPLEQLLKCAKIAEVHEESE